MTPDWQLWRGGRALIHAHAPGNPRSLCGRESTHGTIPVTAPSLQARLRGDACHHCLDRANAAEQATRVGAKP